MLRYIIIITASVLINGSITAQTNPFEKIIYEGEEYYVYPEKQEVSGTNYDDEFYWKYGKIKRGDIYDLSKENKNLNLDGKWIILFDSSVIKPAAIFSIKNNLLEGEYTSYFYTGAIHLKGAFNNGVESGLWNYYYSDGKPDKTEGYIVFKEPWGSYWRSKYGEWKNWDRNGNLYKEKHYDSTGCLDSVFIHYFSNGFKQMEARYKNGWLTGRTNFYYPSGKLKSDFIYVKNLTPEPGIIYYETGEKLSEGKLFEQVKTGKWIDYYQNGKIKSSGNYKMFMTQICMGAVPNDYYHSTKTGRWIYWYEDGSVMAYGDYYSQNQETSRGNIYVSVKAPGWTFFDKDGYPTDEKYFKTTGINMLEEDDYFLKMEEEN